MLRKRRRALSQRAGGGVVGSFGECVSVRGGGGDDGVAGRSCTTGAGAGAGEGSLILSGARMGWDGALTSGSGLNTGRIPVAAGSEGLARSTGIRGLS